MGGRAFHIVPKSQDGHVPGVPEDQQGGRCGWSRVSEGKKSGKEGSDGTGTQSGGTLEARGGTSTPREMGSRCKAVTSGRAPPALAAACRTDCTQQGEKQSDLLRGF